MEKHDVIVVGGGLVGCAAAWHLAEAGASVLIVDAGDFGMGASGQNAGSLHFQIERRFLEQGDALARQAEQTIALSRIAIEEWRGLGAALDADLHVVMEGGFMVAETPDQVALLERKVAREIAEGLRMRLLDGDEARRIAPYLSPRIVAAAFAPDEGHADSRAVTPALAAAARRAGASLRSRTRLSALAKVRGGFEAQGNGLSARADQVLVAAGAWTAQVCALANLHAPLYPVALLMNATERTQRPRMPHLIQHVGRRLSMKQTHAGNILIGGGWPSRLARTADGGFDPGTRPEMIEESLMGNLRAAIDIVPDVASLNLLRSWTGVTAVSGDQLPVVGQVPRMPGFWIAGGGSAFTLGPSFARLVAQAMRGTATPELDFVSPARFDHLNSFMGQ
jgi:sarcosine oxidase subunit beta